MTVPSPLSETHEQLGAMRALYGPVEASIQFPLAYGPVETEYAAIRRLAGLFDAAHLAVIEVRGEDRIVFLDRMVTQKLSGISPGESRPSFWLNRKGRIEADLRTIHMADRTLLILDALALDRTMQSLPGFVFTEDVTFEDATPRTHAIGLHGRQAGRILSHVTDRPEGSVEIPAGRALERSVAGRKAVIERFDLTGEPGFTILAAPDHVVEIFRALSANAREPADDALLARPVGWHALNIARIESGVPLYNVDFGPDSLPAETGVLEDRVSFSKGCYLGQEVVARMKSLGHPRRCLVALRVSDPPVPSLAQPETGDRVLETSHQDSPAVGAITSSCVSPMLGGPRVCFAMMKWGHHTPDTEVYVDLSGTAVPAIVQPSLRFWPPVA